MRLTLHRCVSALTLLTASACRNGNAPVIRPPAADFVLSAGDSAYWVTTNTTGIQWRGAPLDLARVDGRFFEVYVVDDDQSFQGAELIGQNVFRRDLRTGDSVLVYRDTLVPHFAREYARLHPAATRLALGDEPDNEPAWRATATLDLGVTHGAFISFSIHTDVVRDGTPLWHTSRLGMLDLHGNRVASLADVVGAESSAVERRRDQALRSALDSARSLGGDRAGLRLAQYRLDPASFEITSVDGGPAIAYSVPGPGSGNAGRMLQLEPIRFSEPAWWRDIASSLPTASADGSRDVWRHGAYDVVVRYDSAGAARLVVRDSTSREWPIGPIASPATHVYWLDRPALDSVTRRALSKAFHDASSYGEETRVASRDRSGAPAQNVLFAPILPARFSPCSFSPSIRPIARSRSCGESSRTSCENIACGKRRSPNSISRYPARIATSPTRALLPSRGKFATRRVTLMASRPR